MAGITVADGQLRPLEVESRNAEAGLQSIAKHGRAFNFLNPSVFSTFLTRKFSSYIPNDIFKNT